MREGSVVVGRVLEKTGSLYTISLAGRMLNVKSKENLVPGSTFRGVIKIKGEKVEIALFRGDEKSKVLSKSEILEQRLANLGLEKNEVTMRLLDFMTTLGMKLEPQKMKKALSKGKGGSLRQRSAQAGSPTASDSDAELSTRDDEPVESSRSFKRALEATEKKSAEKSEIWLLGDENGVDLSDEELEKMLQRDTETLVEFNSRSKKDFRHGFVLPFDWDYMNMSGSLKVLEKFPDKIVEKVIIDVEPMEKISRLPSVARNDIRFFLEFDKNKLKKVFVFGCGPETLRTFLIKNGFPNVEVEGGDDEKIFSVLKGFSAEV